MLRFVFSRLLGSLVVLAGMSFAIFALIGLMPGDPVDLMAGDGSDTTPESIAYLRLLYGVDTPIATRYWHWVIGLVHGDLGISRLQSQPVLEVIWPALANTILLTATAFIIATGLAIALGSVAALYRGGWPDRVIGLLAYLGISVPSFWLGLMLIYLFAVTLGWLPAGGTPGPDDGAVHGAARMVLPVSTLVLGEVGGPTRYVRAAMIEVLGQDFIRTAHAKGVPPGRLVLNHALRNAMIPVVTIIALGLGHLFSGALLTETVFAWRGMGRMTLEAIQGNDYNLAMICVLLSTAMVLGANILADVAYTLLDPRIALHGGRR